MTKRIGRIGKRLLIVVVVALIAMTLFFYPLRKNSVSELIAEAIFLEQQGDYEGARNKAREAFVILENIHERVRENPLMESPLIRQPTQSLPDYWDSRLVVDVWEGRPDNWRDYLTTEKWIQVPVENMPLDNVDNDNVRITPIEAWVDEVWNAWCALVEPRWEEYLRLVDTLWYDNFASGVYVYSSPTVIRRLLDNGIYWHFRVVNLGDMEVTIKSVTVGAETKYVSHTLNKDGIEVLSYLFFIKGYSMLPYDWIAIPITVQFSVDSQNISLSITSVAIMGGSMDVTVRGPP